MTETTTPTASRAAARPTTRSEILDLAVIPPFSISAPNYAGLTGRSHWSAYEDCRRGVARSRKIGRSVVVLVAPLLRMLDGEDAR